MILNNHNKGETGTLDTLSNIEALMGSMISDENEWSAAWVKLLHYVMKNNKLPVNLQEIDLDVPKKFAYMINGNGSSSCNGNGDSSTKAEIMSPSKPGGAAANGQGEDASSSNSM